MTPTIGVVIVAHDSAEDLPPTLAALLPQLGPGDEVVVVDSGSQDDTAAVVRRAAPEATLVESANVGYAGGSNLGVQHLRGAELVLLLNPDAQPVPGCLDALRAVAAAEPGWGAWQALVTLPDGETINSAGNPVHFLGIAWAGRHGHPVAELPGRAEITSASGAAMVVRRTAWDAAGGFDARYFLYGEDVDLSLRLRLAGWGIGIEPAARVIHDYAFEKGDYKWFYLERNRWWTIVAVYPTSLLLALAPALLAFEAALLVASAGAGWLPAKRAAMGAVLRSLPAMRARRREVQAQRQVSDGTFAAALGAGLDSEFLGAAGRSSLIGGALRAYWALVRAVVGR